jgi:hypothetical protein
MQFSTSYNRRSRLKPITYSMCCQVATMLLRLPTLTLPATAPTAGSANGCTSSRTESDSRMVSPSTVTIRSCRASAMPVLRAFDLPPLGTRITRTLGRPRRSARIAVPSVEPSSTTTTSMSGWSPPANDRTAASMPSFSL